MKPLFYHITIFLLALLSNIPLAFTQQMLKAPFASPKAVSGQTIGITDVTVTYYRPAVKEREIWGKLVPYNTIWRAGANHNTVIHFSTDVTIEGKKLAAGAYGLHMIPSEGYCEIIFSNNSTAWGSFSYKEAEDALRVKVPTGKTEQFYEWLTYDFEDLSQDGAVCALKWEKKRIPFRIAVDRHEIVLTSMRSQLQTQPGWSWQGWYEAANYCLVNDVNHEEAMQWITRSVFMQPTPQNLITKARLTAAVKYEGDEQKAKQVAMKTLEKDLAAHPCTWKEYHAAANFAMQKEAYDQAVTWASHSVAMNPNMTNMMTKAQILEAKGDTEKAKKVKNEAIAKGSNAELNNYGYQLLFAGKADEAVAVFKANTEKYPEDPNVWDSLGEGYVNSGQKDKAIECFKKSLSLNPPDNVRANSMKFLHQLGVNTDEMKMEMKKADKNKTIKTKG